MLWFWRQGGRAHIYLFIYFKNPVQVVSILGSNHNIDINIWSTTQLQIQIIFHYYITAPDLEENACFIRQSMELSLNSTDNTITLIKQNQMLLGVYEEKSLPVSAVTCLEQQRNKTIPITSSNHQSVRHTMRQYRTSHSVHSFKMMLSGDVVKTL